MSEPTLLSQWSDFYVIVGSSAGALTGLQFVVMALIAEAEVNASMLEIRAFGTPTVVHFCVSLLISAIACAPWHELSGAAISLAVCGAAGVVYIVRVIRHTRKQAGYAPDAEDWFWYVASPLAAYATLFVAATLLAIHPHRLLFVVAGIALGLLFIGIHNSWDTVTYITLRRAQPREQQSQK
jgi:hypothetical protein